MRNIAIIPARAGSKRLPDKNMLPFNGLPLFVHSILFAQKNQSIINDIVVSTDSDQIAKMARKHGAAVVKRPPELSGDLEPTVTALEHTLKNLENTYDHVILLQPTNPLRPQNLLKEAYKTFLEHTPENLITVSTNHRKTGYIKDNTFVPANYSLGQRGQDLSPEYYENGLLYIIRSEIILQGKISGQAPFPFIVDHPYAEVDIDTEHDFKKALWYLENYP
ncbi:acylneuraminate cytidylyltransferase family protein [Ascidiimonas aurantiaca]|uniref:acylneuraminate cytidylyltransferase family protein n=1 Tax=Ascidiimonas aurantiaca TaxID=1685432 RepID=UPI0030EC3944